MSGYSDEANRYFRSGKECFYAKEYEEALEYFEKAINLDGNEIDYYFYGGLCEYKLENYIEALNNFTTCIEQDSGNPEYFFRNALCKFKLGELDEAIEDFTSGIELKPLDIGIYYLNRGTVRQHSGDNNGASEDFHLALKYAKDEKQKESARNKIANIKLEKINLKPEYEKGYKKEPVPENKPKKEEKKEEKKETQKSSEFSFENISVSKDDISWFGIDFGTTNSALVSYTGTSATNLRIIPYGDGEGRPLPSLVAIKKDGSEIITGRTVKDRLDEITDEYEYIPSVKLALKENKPRKIGDKTYSAVDIASELFKSLIKRVEKNGDKMTEAVVAVPVGFSSVEKERLREAAKKAGFKIKMFVSEPTAAFCSNYKELKMYKNIAVFDWGGGTLDIAVINVENGRVKELATDGIALAGNDIDEKLAAKMHLKFMQNKNRSMGFDELKLNYPDTYYRFLGKCERAKCDFSDEDEVSISMGSYADVGAVTGYFGYEDFKLLVENEVDKAVECLQNTIRRANLNLQTLDCILCVGGSSNLRPLRDKLREIYKNNIAIYFPQKTMWTIAKGSALISQNPGRHALGKTIGLILSDDSFLPLISEGQKIPCREASVTLALTEDDKNNTNSAKFIFTDSEYESERTFTDYKTVPVRAFEDERITISYYIDPNFIFKLKIESNKKYPVDMWVYDKVKVYYQMEDK